MKCFMVEFCKRGLVASGGGPVILAVIYWILGKAGAITVMTPNEVAMGVLSVTLMAFIIGGISAIYTVERLPLAMASLIQAGVLYLDYLLVYLLNSWLPRNWQAVGIFTAIFAVGFAAIWLVVFLCIQKNIRLLNAKMQEDKGLR